MNLISLVASFLHLTLLIVVYLIVPEVAPEDQVESIKHWVLTAFSAIFLLLIMISAKNEINVFIIFLIGTVVISGIVWWVPTYIPKEDQDLVSHILIVSSSVFITLVSALFSLHETESLGIQQTSALEGIIGGRRRKHK
jgi:uncharacterized membrane protein